MTTRPIWRQLADAERAHWYRCTERAAKAACGPNATEDEVAEVVGLIWAGDRLGAAEVVRRITEGVPC